ncbi:CheW protein [Methanofollis liminatans DSM 4140]|uniref:CheW protein n=1 Tax=Methanofollis liminatans DSM 4140 TaxID=28892 RepID=J1L642_9EURY|nr:chemotaxis protein CheW [Methanofollis liminatans]EJG08285.1 CheW protein [Methanofollis liminatans DSM 4140]
MTNVDVVEFEVADEHYALDISLAREIVEMVPITPVPRAPPHIAGIINLRGEITTVMNLSTLLGIPAAGNQERRKIIILVPEAAGGSNVGIIVDDVLSVMQISENDVEKMDDALTRDAFVKGIIKVNDKAAESGDAKNLIIWVDMQKVLEQLIGHPA